MTAGVAKGAASNPAGAAVIASTAIIAWSPRVIIVPVTSAAAPTTPAANLSAVLPDETRKTVRTAPSGPRDRRTG